MFQFGATCCPGQVWPVLTTPASTPRFLFGVSLESTWELGSPITGWLGGSPVMQGEVLFSECPNRLSYVLASGPDQPEVYVEWELRPCEAGAIVSLSMFDADSDDREEVEALWQPVITRLQALLAGPSS